MGDLIQDIRYSWRVLAGTPGFTLVAVLTLALGIGANTAIFSVINAVLLRPLPYAEPGRLAMLWTATEEDAESSTSWLEFLDWKKRGEAFEQMAVFRRINHNLTGIGVAERLQGSRVSTEFFDVLGISAHLGRTFAAGEDEDGSEKVALISYGLWKSHFGGSGDAVGQSITLDGTPTTVVGVLPARFRFPFTRRETQIWTTMAGDPFKEERGTRAYRAVARLKPNVSVEESRAQMDAVSGRLAELHEAGADSDSDRHGCRGRWGFRRNPIHGGPVVRYLSDGPGDVRGDLLPAGWSGPGRFALARAAGHESGSPDDPPA